MNLIKYAVRFPYEGGWLYRSASSRYAASAWSDAQLFGNAEKAARVAKDLQEWHDQLYNPGTGWKTKLDTSLAEVVTVNIKEPEGE